MALGQFLPPWLNPPDIVGAAARGASLGAELRGQDIQQASAADRLRAAYDQLALKEQYANERAAERQALAAQGLEIRRQALENQAQRNADLASYQQGLLGSKSDLLAQQAKNAENLASYRDQLIAAKNAEQEAKAERGGATVVEHPEFPGMKFLRQPSGTETVIERGEKSMTPAQRLGLMMQAQRMMTPGIYDNPKSAEYQSKTNLAAGILNQLKNQNKPSKGGAQFRYDPDSKTIVPVESTDATED